MFVKKTLGNIDKDRSDSQQDYTFMSDTYEKRCGNCDNVFKTAKDILDIGVRIRVCTGGNLWFNCTCLSTLVIPKGKFDWFSIDSLMSPGARELFQKNKNLEHIPKINNNIMKLQETIEDEKSSFVDMQKQLERSPSLALLTLNMASNLNPQGTEVKDLKHAISLLGRKTLSGLALSASLVDIKLESKLYQIQDYWQEALTSGAISRDLFKKYGHEYSEELADRSYIAGCFAQIGKLIGAISFPTETDKIFNLISNPKTMTTWKKAAKMTKAPEMEKLGEIATVTWGLPEYLKNVVLSFHKKIPNLSPNKKLSLLEATQFANLCYHWLNSSPHLIDQGHLKHFQNHLELDDKGLENLVEGLAIYKTKTEETMIKLF